MVLNDKETEFFENLFFERSVPIRDRYEADLKRIDILDDINKHALYFKVIKEYAHEDIKARVRSYIETYEHVGKHPDEADFEDFADELIKRADRFKELLSRRYAGPFSPLPSEFIDRLIEELSAHLSQIPGFAVAPLRRFISEGKIAAKSKRAPLKVFISYKWEDHAHKDYFMTERIL